MQPSLSARIARTAYHGLRRSPLAPALDSPLVRSVRDRLVGMRPDDVVAVLDAFAAARVRCWVVGGWGVDALVGEQTRPHDDLDLAFDAGLDLAFDEQPEARARRALAELGYEVVDDDAEAGIWMPTRLLARDASGRRIDLLPAAFDPDRAGTPAPPGTTTFAFDDETFTVGRLAGRPVPCLSAPAQLRFHDGYPPRPVDRDDVARLGDCFELTSAG